MKIRKDLAIAVLVTFCLTATLFMIRASWSGGEWDPWVDIKEDGTVDIYDAITLANAYGTSGDTTKNVTIAGHASKLAYSVQDQIVAAGLDFYTPWISVDGYSKVTVCLSSSTSQMACYIHCQHFNFTGDPFEVDRFNGTYSFCKTYDVPNQQIWIHYANRDVVSATIAIDVYLIA